jgi:tetratricopeptide (TPR) repeat protein
VLAAVRAEPASSPEIQLACLQLAGTWPQDARQFNKLAWHLVRDPGQPGAIYQRGLRLAGAACRLQPENGAILNTLGVAQYRCGLMTEAVATLARSNNLNKQEQPSDLAFLALAQHRLGQTEKARSTLGQLREVMKNPRLAGDQEAQAFLREAQTIELDQAFPVDPFAP